MLQSEFTHWGSLATNCWLKNLWRFVCLADIRLTSPTPETFPLQRIGNACVMDKIANFNLTTSNLAAFNCCRIAHQVFFLSDILDGWGHSLHPMILSPHNAPL